MVKATVFDITDAQCKLPTSLFYDTNAWLDLFYPPYSLPGSGRLSSVAHSNFFARCLNENVEIVRSAFSFPEIAHVIESEVVRAYNATVQNTVKVKGSRRMVNLRRKVVSQVIAAWKGVATSSVAHPGLMADDDLATRAAVRYGTQSLDGYDLFVVEQVLASPTASVLTDDFDYVSVPGLAVYTANQAAIREAHAAGRLG